MASKGLAVVGFISEVPRCSNEDDVCYSQGRHVKYMTCEQDCGDFATVLYSTPTIAIPGIA